mgnify:CR=1 FL=1
MGANAFDGRDADFLGHEYSGEDGSLAMYWYLANPAPSK